MTLPAQVTRWRSIAHAQAFWAANRYKVQLDESDLLGLISVESGGNPAAVSKTGYCGLGQIGQAALGDYNRSPAGHEMPVEWAWMKDPDHGLEQIRVIAWLVANGRQIVANWSPPDAKENADLWADARYAWGAGHLRTAIVEYQVEHDNVPPTFDQLAEFRPDAGLPNVRPWHHARTVRARAAEDRGNPVTPISETGESGSVVGDVLALIAIAAIVALIALGLRG